MAKARAEKDPDDWKIHWKGCNCFKCTHPNMVPHIQEDLIGPELMRAHLKYLNSFDVREDKRKEAHWASDALFGCIRKEWLEWHGAVPTNPEYNEQVLELGKSIEEDIIERYKLTGTMVGEDRYIKFRDPRLKYPISGKIDVLVVDDGVMLPVEIKSTKDSNEYKNFDAWKKLLPRGEHVAQLTMYLKDELLKGRNIPRGRVQYYNKNRSLDAWYYVDFVPEFYDEIIGKCKELEDALPKQEPMIPAGLKKDGYPCRWWSQDRTKEEPAGQCAFFDHCWNDSPITLKFEDITW